MHVGEGGLPGPPLSTSGKRNDPAMTIKLQSLKNDTAKEREGDVIKSLVLPGVSWHVRSVNAPSFVTKRDLVIQKLTRKYGQNIPEEVRTVEFGKLYAAEICLGWTGFDVAYSPEAAEAIFSDPEYREVTYDMLGASVRVGRGEMELVEEAAGNSERPSATI